MTSGPRWSRAPLPWRTTLAGIIVATDDDETLLAGHAAVVWDVLEQPRTEAELISDCAELYGLDEAGTARGLAALTQAGLCIRT